MPVYIVNTDPKKYNRYGNTNKNSPKYGIFPINASRAAIKNRNTSINKREIDDYIIGCQCRFT